ncbi:MAG: signal recognition particle-docking protein FtsY [Phycisphaerales bacterium]|nr:signal recognition particle-docking protein FtsY [Phycisphaerales bacterium]MCB9855019.1 signal recognition particle-docking protein FtsY [Phycisphaerales bacterium]MCB9863464.1 signal recognition particle-docking protein FtsY [Phycisphaerales bacterium]
MGLFDRFKKALTKTRDKVVSGLRSVLPFGRPIDEALLDDVYDTMITDDFGPKTADNLIAAVRNAWKKKEISESQHIIEFLKKNIVERWPDDVRLLAKAPSGPTVVLVAGINGSGKTTSVAKLANHLKKNGKKVVLAACDTYRAAAVAQLTEWAGRCGVDIVKHDQGADPGAVAYDATEAAIARNADILLVDTAGRLHTQDNLMRELNKIQRVIEKKIPGAPHEVLLVLDATIGQNAVQQAKHFSEHVRVSGIILAKLDGSAKGGIVVGIRDQLDVPVKYVGLGEQIDDIEPFDPQLFVDALFAE